MTPDPKITTYITLLHKYNENINIFSKKAYDDIDFHIQDAKNIANLIGNTNKKIIDLGSGGGFPSIIIAIQNPQNKITAIESKTKKTNFLSQVKDALNLTNFTVINGDAHQVLPGLHPDIITAKAFKKYPEVLKMIQKYTPPNTRCIIPISQNQYEDIPKSPPKGLKLVTIPPNFYYIDYDNP